MRFRIFVISLIVITGILQFLSFSQKHLSSVEDNVAKRPTRQHDVWHSILYKAQHIFKHIDFSKTLSIPHPHVNKKNEYSHIYSSQIVHKKTISSYPNYYSESNNGIVFNTQNTESPVWVYISENLTNDIMRCQLGINRVTNCKVIVTGLMGAEHVAISSNEIFIVNYTQPLVSYCSLTESGDIDSCGRLKLPVINPAYIEYINNQLLISDLTYTSMAMCNLDNNFLPHNCYSIKPISRNVFNTAVYKNYSYSIIYNANYMAMVNKCAESTCTILNDPNLTSPTTIEIFNSVAYLLDFNTNSLVSCKLSLKGDFLPCNVLKSGLNSPLGLAFYTSGN